MKEEDKEDKLQTGVCLFAIGMAVLFCVIVLSSCKTQVKVVTEYKEKFVHDTTQVVDSVFQDRVHYVVQRGDTIFKTDSVFLYKYKYLNHDVNVYVHDSVPYPVEVQVPVKYRSGYDRFCSWAFWIIIVCVILSVAWWAFKKFYLHK